MYLVPCCPVIFTDKRYDEVVRCHTFIESVIMSIGVILGIQRVRVPSLFGVGVPYPHFLRAVTAVGRLAITACRRFYRYICGKRKGKKRGKRI